MNINTSIPFVLRDVYLHDIEACHYQILKNLGIDISHIDPENKLKRNIQIGLMFRDNPALSEKVREITNSTISQYIDINKVKDDELVIRQYDGMLTTRRLEHTSDFMEIPVKEKFDIFIISIDRNKYIAISDDEITIKGVSHSYEKIEAYYKRLLKINYLSKESIFRNLELIKNDLITNKDVETFAIPIEGNKFKMFFKKYDDMDISSSMMNLLEVEDIDRIKYFDLYLKPFTRSIVYEYI
jgi:hypothetical protein